MAYIDFSVDPSLSGLAGSPRHDPLPTTARLSALEWSIVALARNDRLSSLAEPSRLSIALGRVFGGRSHHPRLADPQLEALRRMAVFSWHRGFSVPSSEVKAFLRAGYTADQYETMLASIAEAQARVRATA